MRSTRKYVLSAKFELRSKGDIEENTKLPYIKQFLLISYFYNNINHNVGIHCPKVERSSNKFVMVFEFCFIEQETFIIETYTVFINIGVKVS